MSHQKPLQFSIFHKETINLGAAHLEMFLGALSHPDHSAKTPVSNQPISHRVRTKLLTREFGMLGFDETMLDKYLFGAVSAPMNDMDIWEELRQVGYQQSKDLAADLECMLAEIAAC